MKKLLLIFLLLLPCLTFAADEFTINRGVAMDSSGGPIRLKATKNVDGTYTLNTGVSISSATFDTTGLATSANQTTANTSLSAINGKLPALSGGAVPVTASALPLPTGAATASNQSTANTSLSSIDTKTPALVTGRVPVDGSGVTQPVSAASLPLPTGAATSANQTTSNTSLSSIDGKLPALVSSRVPVDGSGVTQPISGSVTANPATGTLVNSSAYESGHVLKGSAGTLISLTGYNSGPSQFILLYDSATVPANGSSAVKVLFVPAQTNFSTDVPITGLPFSTGISVSNSSTAPTKTVGSTDVFYTAVVR